MRPFLVFLGFVTALGGFALGIWGYHPSLPGWGGATAVALSFALLFTADTAPAQLAEGRPLPKTLDPTAPPAKPSLEERVERLEQGSLFQRRREARSRIWLVSVSVLGTLMRGLGDWGAAELRLLLGWT